MVDGTVEKKKETELNAAVVRIAAVCAAFVFGSTIGRVEAAPETLVHALSRCDGSFFHTVFQRRRTFAPNVALRVLDGEATFALPKNDLGDPKQSVQFRTPIADGSLRLAAYFDESPVLGYTWGFYIKGKVDDVVRALRPTLYHAQRLHFAKGANAYVAIDAWQDGHWEPENNDFTAGRASGDLAERGFLVESGGDEWSGYTSVACTLQGTFTKEMVHSLRPDLALDQPQSAGRVLPFTPPFGWVGLQKTNEAPRPAAAQTWLDKSPVMAAIQPSSVTLSTDSAAVSLAKQIDDRVAQLARLGKKVRERRSSSMCGMPASVISYSERYHAHDLALEETEVIDHDIGYTAVYVRDISAPSDAAIEKSIETMCPAAINAGLLPALPQGWVGRSHALFQSEGLWLSSGGSSIQLHSTSQSAALSSFVPLNILEGAFAEDGGTSSVVVDGPTSGTVCGVPAMLATLHVAYGEYNLVLKQEAILTKDRLFILTYVRPEVVVLGVPLSRDAPVALAALEKLCPIPR